MSRCMVCRRRLAPAMWQHITVDGHRTAIHVRCHRQLRTAAANLPASLVASATPADMTRIARAIAVVIRIRERNTR